MTSSPTIARVRAREVLNFRGDPTLEAEVILSNGIRGSAAVPAGISTGSNEVYHLLDGDPNRFGGKGVLKAVQKVHEIIAPAVTGADACDQEAIDRRLLELDGTPNKRVLGGNCLLAVSLAAAHAATASLGMPLYRYVGGNGPFRLPVIAYNMFAGGSHAKNSVDLQEFLVIPIGLSGLKAVLEAGVAVYRALRSLLQQRGYVVQEAGGGALSAPLPSNETAMEIVAAAIEAAGYAFGTECVMAIDAAASELCRDGRYVLKLEGRQLTASGMADLWEDWVSRYPIVSIEDPLAEEDWEGWRALTQRIGKRVQLIGDDLFTTNPDRVRRGVELQAANAVLIKPNQIGTLTEALQTMRIAHTAGWANMLSTRSGETEDTTVADLSVLETGGQIKTGPPWRQVVIKHNRLLRIEEELGDEAAYAGIEVFAPVGSRSKG